MLCDLESTCPFSFKLNSGVYIAGLALVLVLDHGNPFVVLQPVSVHNLFDARFLCILGPGVFSAIRVCALSDYFCLKDKEKSK